MEGQEQYNEGGQEEMEQMMGMPQYADLSTAQGMDQLQQQNPDQMYQQEEEQPDEEEGKLKVASRLRFHNFIIVERQWLWAFPQIEGVPPSPRGGHSATLTGASLVIFGVS